jgi:PGF-CTERM protein
MARITVLFLVTALVLAGIPTAATAQSDDVVTMTVSVVDRSGDPVGSATIEATWDGGEGTGTTRANGKALIDVPRGETVDFEVQNADYIRNTPYTVQSASEREVGITVAERGKAVINVTNPRGEEVEDAIVRLWHNGKNVVNARTGSDGIHQTQDIEHGEYTLVTFKGGYVKNRTTITVDGVVGEHRTISQSSVPVTLTVTDDNEHFETPEPVENAQITVEGVGSVNTLSNGEYTMSLPVNDEYDVTVTKDGYDEVTPSIDIDEEPTSLDVSIQRIPAISINPGSQRIVIGENASIEVTNEYGTPVEGATVSFDGSTVGETDENGELEFPIDSEGEHTIRAEWEDLSTSQTIEGVQAAEKNGNGTAEESGGDGPGFTPVVGVVAVLLAAGLLRRRRH